MSAVRIGRIVVMNVGVANHQRDSAGRIYFPRCETNSTDCHARPNHLARINSTTSAMLCDYHARRLLRLGATRGPIERRGKTASGD